MQYFTIGIKVYFLNSLFQLDVCPFYWKLFYEEADEMDGFVMAFGPLFLTILA